MLQLPEPKSVKDLLDGLLGRSTELSPGKPVSIGSADRSSLAVYVDAGLGVQGFVVVDLPLAAYSGAALGLVPAPQAKSLVEEGNISGMVADNFAEVLNVAGSLFHIGDNVHTRLHRVFLPGDEIPLEWRTAASVPAPRLDLDVEIPGYGRGAISFVSML